MSGTAPSASAARVLRPLTDSDLEAVVAIDKATVARSRRGYFRKRMEAALRHPQDHVQLGIDSESGLAGYALARFREGEFGKAEPVLVIEAIGVSRGHRREGLGRDLMAGIEAAMRPRGVRILQTQAAWNEHALLGFLDALGFNLAPCQVLDCLAAGKR